MLAEHKKTLHFYIRYAFMIFLVVRGLKPNSGTVSIHNRLDVHKLGGFLHRFYQMKPVPSETERTATQ